ncbi:hypothetical protein [Streptosporangium longisporum]|uniref:Uncharacterized protein n=1 Tax=Streptosporangium longisporum TaxID=46187 RepID=A0ABP6KZC3_9ACTN
MSTLHAERAALADLAHAESDVYATIAVSRMHPRNLTKTRAAMRRSCKNPRFAEKAFYQYWSGDELVHGESVHLARELARCWGNVDYGVNELDRDEVGGRVQLQVYAWDTESNVRRTQTFWVRALDQPADPRDVYGAQADIASRRLRAVIISVLPVWLVEEAKDLCHSTLVKGDGRPMQERVGEMVDDFAGLGVTVDQLEGRVGSGIDEWSPYDVAQLQVLLRGVRRRELAVEEVFPTQRVTLREIASGLTPLVPVNDPPADDDPPAPDAGEPVSTDRPPGGDGPPAPDVREQSEPPHPQLSASAEQKDDTPRKDQP